MARPVSVTGYTNEVMYKYDHNKNGKIDLKRPEKLIDRLKNPDERVRSTTSVNNFGDNLNVSTSVQSQRDLFYAADKNGDGVATREEIEAVVKGFDKDGDGQMASRGFWGWLTRKPKQELDFFNDQYKERTINYGSVDIPLK